jgi:[acyl-carrier-protein] S-malonyltransferase
MIRTKLGFKYLSTSSIFRGSSKNVKDLLDNAALGNDEIPTNPDDFWATNPYPKGAVHNRKRLQGMKVSRPKIDPKETSIILFPGQGAQYVGMAKQFEAIPEARDLFEIASEVLRYDLLKLCNEGPKEKLDQTKFSQPAIAVTSLASLERLDERHPNSINDCVAAAGFSLGEITALIFAGAISFEKGIKLIQVRAEAMQLASEENPSGMATVLFGPDSDLGKACIHAKEWCLETGVENPECKIANYLYPSCKVVAGSLEALKFLEKNAKSYKLRKIRRLPVSGAFHTSLMEPAVEPFTRALKKIDVHNPCIRVHSCIDGMPYRNADHILKQLPKQIIRPVKWEQLLHILYERPQGNIFPKTYECAPGRSLATILKKVNSKAGSSMFNADLSIRLDDEDNTNK